MSFLLRISHLSILSLGLCLGCSPSKPSKAPLSHTYKLQRPLAVSFKSQNTVFIQSGLNNKISLKIFLKKDKAKTLLEKVDALDTNQYTLSLPEDISDYDYVVAIVESEGKYGNINSAVDTYKIGEQKLINDAKKSLKNRN